MAPAPNSATPTTDSGVVDLQRQLIAGLEDRLLQQPHRPGASWPSDRHRHGRQGDRVVGMLLVKPRGGRGGLFGLPQVGLQRELGRQQAGPVGIFLRQLVDLFQCRGALFAFDHPLELFQLGQEFGAAEFDLLASAAGTRRIGIESHDLLSSG